MLNYCYFDYFQPYLGSLEGPSAFAAGIGKGTGALFTGVATGLVGYTASLVNTASSGVSLVARGVVVISSGGGDDDKFLQSRETKKRLFKASDGGVLKGFQQGGMDVLAGIGSGFKGLVTKPMNEGKKSGALGVMRGIGMGLVGAVVKPVLGISDGISTVTAGVTKEMLVDSSHQAKHARPSRALERANPLSDKVLVLLPMDVFAAKAQDFLRQITGQQDEYLASCSLGYEVTADEFPDAEYGLLLSTSHIYLLSTSIQVIWTISFSELSLIVLKKNANPHLTEADHSQFGMLGFLLYGCSLMVQKTLTCPNRVHALRVYGFMCKFAYRMGNPSAVVPLEEHLAEVTRPIAHSSATATVSQREGSVSEHRGFRLDQYIFGFANNMQLSITLSMNFMTEEHIITQARERFRLIYCMNMSDEEAVYFYYRLLDEALFTLAMDWKNFHTLKLTPSHCCVCLLLNSSPSYAPVQILDIDMIEGRDYHIFSVGGAYDTASQSIAPGGGGVVLFAYGHPPTLNDTPTVKIFVKTTAFSVILSSRAGEPNCTTHNGFTVSYLEKARSNYWSKSVINISLHK